MVRARRCYEHWRCPTFYDHTAFITHARELSNKKANYSEETKKVKRRAKIVKRGQARARRGGKGFESWIGRMIREAGV